MMMKYFTVDEFRCPDCGRAEMDENLLELLDKARSISNVPYRITSGFRCKKHNEEIGGVPDSAHTRGLAVDIAAADGRTRYRIIAGLIKAGFPRIGIARSFIHADIDYTKPHPTIWLYRNK